MARDPGARAPGAVAGPAAGRRPGTRGFGRRAATARPASPHLRYPGYTPRRDGGLGAYEAVLARAGFAPVAGIDEAGRGACAGPLVVAAVVLDPACIRRMPGLADSKMLTPDDRERAYHAVLRCAIDWHVVVIGPRQIDAAGLHVCNVDGMRRAFAGLRAHRRLRGARARRARAGRLEGRPGHRLGGRGLGAGQGQQGPDDAGPARTLSLVRLRPAQGVRHRGPRARPGRARAVPGAPVLVRERDQGPDRRRGRGRGPHRCRRRGGGRHDTRGRRGRSGGRVSGDREENGLMSAEDLEKYEAEMELQLYREYRDVVGLFTHVVETERRFYLTNEVELNVRNSDNGEVFFEVTMRDAWVWDMYRPARFVKNVRVVTFKDVNIEELAKADLELPDDKPDQPS